MSQKQPLLSGSVCGAERSGTRQRSALSRDLPVLVGLWSRASALLCLSSALVLERGAFGTYSCVLGLGVFGQRSDGKSFVLTFT